MADKVESFQLDHRKLKAPYVRRADRLVGPRGDVVTKFDLRFLQPNAGAMPTGALHTLEHLLAVYLREELVGIIDLSPMGCRTGFYLTLFGEPEVEEVKEALKRALEQVLAASEVPAANEVQCGHYRDHSLAGAKEYASLVLAAL
ncbi:MAG: S-ribosylhomocysteine lyase [bacterium]